MCSSVLAPPDETDPDRKTVPLKIIPLRTSERVTFKECRQKWWWAYEERLARADRPPAPALRFGDLVHRSLATYYRPGRRRGPLPARTYVKLLRDQRAEGMPELRLRDTDDPAKKIDPEEFGVAMLEGYVREYGQDDRFEIIQPEQAFQIDILHPRTGRYLFTYVSTMDAVIRDLNTMKLGLFEHKTSSDSRMAPFGAPLGMDEQASAYWTFGTMWLRAMGYLSEGEDLDFMLYNFLRKAMPDTRPEDSQGRKLNKDGSVSKRQPLPNFRREWVMRGEAEREVVFRRALNEFREMQMVRQGKLAVYKSPGKPCQFCQFRDMCEVHETGSDWEAIRDNMFTVWDPYESHDLLEEDE